MNPKNPLVSLIVRTKDRPKFLNKALRSIAKQTYSNIEVVLINDGGCDLDMPALEKLLNPVSLCYIKNDTPQRRSAAANSGLDKMSGEYVGFLDDDDELLPHHIETLMGFLTQSDYLIAYTNVEEYQKTFDVDSDSYQSELLTTYSKDFNANELLLYNYIPFNALLFHVDSLKDQRLDSQLDLYEDWDLLIRLSQKYPFYHIDKVTAHYNKWSDDLQINNTSQIESMRANQNLIIQRYLSNIPADFLRTVWSEYLDFPKTRQNLEKDKEAIVKHFKQDSKKLQTIIDERQALINDLEANVGKIIAEKDAYFQSQMRKVKASHAKDEQKQEQQHQKAFQKLEKQHKKELDQAYTLLEKQYKKELEQAHTLVDEYLTINGDCKRALSQANQTTKSQQQRADYHRQQAEELNHQIQQLHQQLHDKNASIQQKSVIIHQLEIDIANLHNDLAGSRDELTTIQQSLAWRVVGRIRRLLIAVFPADSWRKKAYINVRHAIGQGLRTLMGTKR